MHTRLASLFFASLVLSSPPQAADPTDIVFREGAVLVRCMAPTGQPQVSTAVFNAGFPRWIDFVQKQANAGVVSRAHYLSELKDGLFIVVEGETRDAAIDNAAVIIKGMNAITAAAVHEAGESPTFDPSEACQQIEIGPVAVLPL